MKRENFNVALLIIIPVYFVYRLLFSQIDIYVSPKGDDTGRGGIFKSVASVERAIDIAGELRKSGKNKDIVIHIDGGRYEIGNTLEIDSSLAPGGSGKLRIIAKKGQQVKLSGGKIIDRQDIDKTEAGLLKIDLLKQGINAVEPRAVGFGRPYGEAWTELFIDGDPCILSRWPDSTMVPIGKIIDMGSIPRNGDYSGRGAIFRYDVKRPSAWTNTKDIWIAGYFMHGYADDAVRLKEIDTIGKKIITAQPTLYGFGSGKPWQTWYAYNIKEEITTQDEYYLDREGYILFMDRDNISCVEVSVLGDPIMTIENISNVTVEGIIFECSRGMGVYMENTSACSLVNCTFRNLGSVAVCLGRGIKPFKELKHDGDGVPQSRIIGSLSQHSYTNTLFNRNAGVNNGLMNCIIYNTGAGGIHMGGGDRKTLEPAANYVINTKISNYNRIEKSYRAAIDISGVGNRISNCEIYDAPSMAILLHGNEHVISFNNIHDVCKDVDDQGAIYYGRDPSERGLKIYFNYFHNIGNSLRTTSVYHDDGACGSEVYGNIFYKAGTIPVLIGGGSDHIYRNNMFIDCKLGIHVDNRFQNWSAASLEPGGIIDTRLNAVNYNQAPYSVKYPELINYWEEDPSLPKRNIVENNVFINVENLYRWNEEWLEIGDNISLDSDPGFVNYGVDFTLDKESLVFEKLPGFKAIPFDKIGPQKLGRTIND